MGKPLVRDLVEIDVSAWTWVCNHCGVRIPYDIDPTAIFEHLATMHGRDSCISNADADADEYELAMCAHLIKHPEDEDAIFKLPSVPLAVLRDAAQPKKGKTC